jgi:hypothetical protein
VVFIVYLNLQIIVIVSIDRFDNSGSINANAWISLFKLDLNDETNTVKFYVNKLNIFDLINDKISNQTFTDTIALYAMNKDVCTKTNINDSITTLNNSINLKANTTLLDSYYTKLNMDSLLSTINTNVSSKANSSVLTSYYTKPATDTFLT